MYSNSKTSQWIYMYLQTVPYYCIIDTEFLWFPLNHIPEFNKNKNYSELLSLLFYLSQGSLHQVSPKFLEQTLDKKLMSNMRVRWWIPLILATLVFCHQYVGEKASINVIIYIYSYMHYCSVNSCCCVFEATFIDIGKMIKNTVTYWWKNLQN